MLKDILCFKGTWRVYQQRVLDRYDQYVQDRKIHIVAAPGSGKTTLGIELIKRINYVSLILVPSITIREQWIERIKEAFLNHQETADQYISQDLKNPKLITVVTYQALHSAMNHYKGQLIESHDELQTVEDVDYQNYDVIQFFKEKKLGTICLDECHHLRNEWWKSLENFKNSFPDIYTIALTATPPYDDSLSMWTRYMNMCGEIDEQITVPELVKVGTLCPHQDYVYFNYPTSQEKKEIQVFEKNSKNLLKDMIQDEVFYQAVLSHRFIKDDVSGDELLENPAYLSSMLIYLNEKGTMLDAKYQRLLGYQSLEPFSLKWLEILLQGFLFEDSDSYCANENYREELIKKLKSQGLIEKKKVFLTINQTVEKMLINSAGKCDSIKTIVNHEYKILQKDLRLLILTDYIRKEYERTLGDETKNVNKLGVLPFFEQLRRNNKSIKLGVLCGTIIIIPKNAQNALLQIVDQPNKISFHPVGKLEDYVKIEVIGDRRFLTMAISELFSKGYMQVLIGTKSLLGEGWDSPCVNALILASFVGSYMLSNQMRGRAIRVFKGHPDKTSHIWHLVCVNPKERDTDDFNNSEDFETLSRRMDHFLGLHYQYDTIESGIERLSAIHTPFSYKNIKQTNKEMLEMSSKRDHLKQRWDQSLAIYEKIEVVEETKVKNKMITSVLFIDALRIILITTISNIIYFFIIALRGYTSFLANVLVVIASMLIILVNGKKAYIYKNPLSRLKIFGQGIRNALEKTNQLESINSRVECESSEGFYSIYLLGGTGHDKALFAKCINEFYDSIDNQRYILYNPKRINKLDAYFVVPDCFAKRKEDANIFASYMKPYIGEYQIIYTRNEKGRRILLQARAKALANREERCITKRKVKGAVE